MQNKIKELLIYPGLPLLFIILWGIAFFYFCEKEKQENAENHTKSVPTKEVQFNHKGWGYGWTMGTNGKMHYGYGFRF